MLLDTKKQSGSKHGLTLTKTKSYSKKTTPVRPYQLNQMNKNSSTRYLSSMSHKPIERSNMKSMLELPTSINQGALEEANEEESKASPRKEEEQIDIEKVKRDN